MKNKIPTWAILVAIVMMLMGGCGLKNDLQSIKIRSFIEMKDQFFKNLDKKKKTKTNHESKDTVDKLSSEEILLEDNNPIASDNELNSDTSSAFSDLKDEKFIMNDTSEKSQDTMSSEYQNEDFDGLFGNMIDLSEDTIQLIITFGYIGSIFSILLIIGGIFLLIRKVFSLRLAYIALGANIIFCVIKWIMLSGKGGKIISMGNSLGSAFAIFLSIIVLIVIISCDRTYLEETYTD